MRDAPSRLVRSVAGAALLALVSGAAAASDTEQRCTAVLASAWAEAMGRAGIQGTGLATPDEARRVLSRLSTPSECQGVPAESQDAEAIVHASGLGRAIAGHSSILARSFEAAASNPASVDLVERAGLIDKVALAIGSTNLVSADETAVTLSLNAAALLSKGPEDLLARLGGSMTFGAKIPESEITGFSGFPDLGRLFDVFVWDVKVTLIGNRNPLGRKWRPDRERLGRDGWIDAALLGVVPTDPTATGAQLANLQAVLAARGVARVEEVKEKISRSWLVSAKFAGQYLTEQTGKNKYSASLFLDGGLGAADLTANATYSVVQDDTEPGLTPFDLRTWAFAAGLTGSIMSGALIKDRSTEWSLAADVSVPADGAGVPVSRKTLWKTVLVFKFPFTKTAYLLVSVVYTNDPNALSKQKYVRGQIGIQYDFGSLKRLAGE